MRMDTCVCMAESLCCSPEMTMTLLISYTLIQNVFDVKKNNNKKNSEKGSKGNSKTQKTKEMKNILNGIINTLHTA